MSAQSSSENPNVVQFPGPTILIVEDDEVTAFMLGFLLEREGYIVTRALDGKQAQQIIQDSQPFDIVLFDIIVPYINGFELITHIARME